jgi:Bacterial type II and III secretion system protein
MKLILILGAVCLLGYFAYKSLYGSDKKSLTAGLVSNGLTDMLQSGTGTKNTKPIDKPIDPSLLPPSVGNPLTSVPSHSCVYVFRFREVPEATRLESVSRLGCSFLADSVSRSVFLSGNQESVAMGLRYLESLDVSPRSCGVQTWAVYVDSSASHGYDIVAAIKAVTPKLYTGSITQTGIVLELSPGDIDAALNVICDGTTVTMIQRPYIHLIDQIPASIESIKKIPIASNSISNGFSQNSIGFEKVGLVLSVTPRFYAGRSITLDCSQSNGIVASSSLVSGNNVPVIDSQLIKTSVSMDIGQAVVLGGVSTTRSKTSRGFLHDTEELTNGSLYIIIATYPDIPFALPVDSSPRPRLPLVDYTPDNSVLPPKNWLQRMVPDFSLSE